MNLYERSIYKQKVNRFRVLEADAKHFKISFIGMDGKVLHESPVEK